MHPRHQESFKFSSGCLVGVAAYFDANPAVVVSKFWFLWCFLVANKLSGGLFHTQSSFSFLLRGYSSFQFGLGLNGRATGWNLHRFGRKVGTANQLLLRSCFQILPSLQVDKKNLSQIPARQEQRIPAYNPKTSFWVRKKITSTFLTSPEDCKGEKNTTDYPEWEGIFQDHDKVTQRSSSALKSWLFNLAMIRSCWMSPCSYLNSIVWKN